MPDNPYQEIIDGIEVEKIDLEELIANLNDCPPSFDKEAALKALQTALSHMDDAKTWLKV